MRSPNKIVLSRRAVDALPVAEREAVFWDRDLSGFGVRVHPTGSKVYMVHARAQGRSRRVTTGRHGVWTPERARREAGRLIASLKAGETPRRPGADSPSANGPTIADMAERYMTEHVAVRCKPTTQRGCRHILNRFLLPRFGALRLSEVSRAPEARSARVRLRELSRYPPAALNARAGCILTVQCKQPTVNA